MSQGVTLQIHYPENGKWETYPINHWYIQPAYFRAETGYMPAGYKIVVQCVVEGDLYDHEAILHIPEADLHLASVVSQEDWCELHVMPDIHGPFVDENSCFWQSKVLRPDYC